MGSSGLVHSSHADILWVSDGGDQAVLRINPTYVRFRQATAEHCGELTLRISPHDREAQRILAAIALTPLTPHASSIRLSVLKDSPFLPSLLAVESDKSDL